MSKRERNFSIDYVSKDAYKMMKKKTREGENEQEEEENEKEE